MACAAASPTACALAEPTGCCFCCKYIWESEYDCETSAWGVPTMLSSTYESPCGTSSDWAYSSGRKATRTVWGSQGTACSTSPGTPALPTLAAPAGCGYCVSSYTQTYNCDSAAWQGAVYVGTTCQASPGSGAWAYTGGLNAGLTIGSTQNCNL